MEHWGEIPNVLFMHSHGGYVFLIPSGDQPMLVLYASLFFIWCSLCSCLSCYLWTIDNRWVGWDVIAMFFMILCCCLLAHFMVVTAPYGLYDETKGVMPLNAWLVVGLLFAVAGTLPVYLKKIFRRSI